MTKQLLSHKIQTATRFLWSRSMLQNQVVCSKSRNSHRFQVISRPCNISDTSLVVYMNAQNGNFLGQHYVQILMNFTKFYFFRSASTLLIPLSSICKLFVVTLLSLGKIWHFLLDLHAICIKDLQVSFDNSTTSVCCRLIFSQFYLVSEAWNRFPYSIPFPFRL